MHGVLAAQNKKYRMASKICANVLKLGEQVFQNRLAAPLALEFGLHLHCLMRPRCLYNKVRYRGDFCVLCGWIL
jgi:hypothetical protein